jgi:phosphomevalonate kinase
MTLIAISGKRRTGKSALGEILAKRFMYTPISLAEPLKAMCRQHFGLTPDQTDGTFKESPTQYKDEQGQFLTPRAIMIKVGAFYRSIDKDFWIKKLFDQISPVPQAQTKTYVVTDVRFKNELEWMKRHKAYTIRLEREESLTGANINDASETELDGRTDWDMIVPAASNRNMEDLELTALRVYTSLVGI